MKNRKTSLSAALAVALVMVAGNAAAQSVDPATGAVTMGRNATAGNHAVAISSGANASGEQAVAIGADATATGESAVATGTWASADGVRASAYGPAAKADGKDSVAVGFNANAAGDRGVAVGQSTYAAVGSSAFGDGAEATGSNATAIGGGADAKGDLSTAVGLISQAIGRWSVAMGNNAQAQTDGSVSIGTASWVSGTAGTTVGYASAATAYGASAYGTFSKATGYYSSAMGAYSTASHENSVALGYGSTTTASNQVAIGGRTMSQVRAGLVSATSTEAINGSQLYQTNQRVTAVENRVTAVEGRVGKVEKKQDVAGETIAAALGGNSTYNDETGEVSANLAYGDTQHNSVQSALDAIKNDVNGKVEYDRLADGTIDYTGVTLGDRISGALTTIRNVNAGRVDADSTEAVNGSQLYQTNQRVAKVEDKQDVAGASTASSFGGNSTYNAETGEVSTNLAYGDTQHNSVQSALDAIKNDVNGKVEYDRLADGTIDFTGVTLGDRISGALTTIRNVNAGRVDADSAEAVNGSQLHVTNQRVTKVEGKQDAAGASTASSFGGNSTYNAETGEVSTSLAYKNTQHDSVQGALDAIADDSNGKVEYERNADGSINYTRVSLGGPRVGNGTQGNPLTTISNVNAGTLDTDAVNVWQLNQMRNGLQGQIDDQWEAIRDLNGRVNGLDKRMGQMGAMSAALAMMNGAGEAGLPVGQIAYSGAWGQYGSHSAFAIGAKVRTSERASLSLGVSYNGGKAMGGIGFSYIGR